MNERKFNLMLSMAACFVAIQTGALVVCLGMMLLEGGALTVLEGFTVWVFAQPFILFFALLSMPIGALLRMLLGFAFARARLVSLVTGSLVGLAGSAILTSSQKDGIAGWVPIVSVGLVAGFVGGWTWWRIEKPFLDHQNPHSEPKV